MMFDQVQEYFFQDYEEESAYHAGGIEVLAFSDPVIGIKRDWCFYL